jgi:acetyl esterase/lipase
MNTRLISLASMCLSFALAAGADKAANHPPGFVKPEPDAIIPLWPGDAPNLVSGGKPETFVNERYANVSVPQLFVYLPPKEKASGTALVICAGGGYGHLAMCLHVENVVKLLNDQGIAVFGLKYRTRYGNNDVVQDALADGQRAVRIVRSRAQEWAIDPHRVGVQGYSAGGNLCLNLAGRFDTGDPQAVDPIERFSCRPDFCALMCPWPNKRTIDEFPLSKDSPPTFIANARDDKTAPLSFALAIDEKLKGLGVKEKLFVVDSGGHGAFHSGVVEGPGARWPEALLPWLKQIAAGCHFERKGGRTNDDGLPGPGDAGT